MQTLLDSLSQSVSQILLGLIVAFVVLALATLRQRAQLAAVRDRWRTLAEGVSGANLERLLEDHLRERIQLEAQLRKAEERISTLEQRMRTSKRHLGLVRYNAFDEVGGEQSFALALYDDQGNGALINGIVGRRDCRVYAKPLVAGRSDRSLGLEETRAIEEAVRGAPKSVLTP